jgi:nucleotide-binding universal stress UspA family protein
MQVHPQGFENRALDAEAVSKTEQATPGPVLFATDFSDASERAFVLAMDLAGSRGAELVVLHVYPPPPMSAADDWFLPGFSDEVEAASCDADMEKIRPLIERARGAGLSARGLVLAGDPGEMVVRAAERAGAGLVVLGTHGRRGVRRALFGSVAAGIIAHARCPVLTVRAA